ncbi:MAG: peptide chain release factor 3 [Chloroflexota bacterium]
MTHTDRAPLAPDEIRDGNRHDEARALGFSTASPLSAEIARRRTFAIISHPDAGKTTLTEKLLLYGGAIHLAGSVRSRQSQRATASDWMALEQARGISISSTVLQFPYAGCQINLLDTPGHQDFSEDTYRTLSAVDSAVMVIDAARGVEEQTKKLFAVCRRRGIPIFTFINKLDRPARDPFELLDDLESVLGIGATPMNWPIGDGPDFRGVFDRSTAQVHLFDRTEGGRHRAPVQVAGSTDPALAEILGANRQAALQGDLELLEGAGVAFDPARVAAGEQTPVFFGSALTNFGLELFLDAFVRLAPSPGPRLAGDRVISPEQSDFAGFIFKIQANIDPQHRDSIAFLRICAGRFERDMTVQHVQGGRKVRLAYAHRLFGQDRETIEQAFPGDVVGLVSHGQFAIGDTLAEDPTIRFDALPRFQPEHFARLLNTDTTRYKQFQKGLVQLEREGVIQLLHEPHAARREPILAAVGRLQFDVVQFRLQAEYGTSTELEHLDYRHARWLERRALDGVRLPWGRGTILTDDNDGLPVALFANDWQLRHWQQEYPELGYREISTDAGVT